MYPRQIAKEVQKLCEDKKGQDVLILDVRKLTDITAYFVIVSGNSTRHVHALGEHIRDGMKQKKVRPWHVEGQSEAKWIVLDYGDVIVHVFYTHTRKYYNLERLWGDAPRVS